MKFPIAHISGNWNRVALDFQNLFIHRYPGDSIVHLHDPTVPAYCVDMEVALESMIEMGKKAKSMGVNVAAIACNTMHLHKERFEQSTGLKMIHMIDRTKEKIRNDFKGKKARVGIIGTLQTMGSNLYDFEDDTITTVVPNREERQYLQDTIINSLVMTSPHVNAELVSFLRAWGLREDLDALVLGCTDFPTLFGVRDGMEGLFAKEFTFQVYDPVEVLVDVCGEYLPMLPNVHALCK